MKPNQLINSWFPDLLLLQGFARHCCCLKEMKKLEKLIIRASATQVCAGQTAISDNNGLMSKLFRVFSQIIVIKRVQIALRNSSNFSPVSDCHPTSSL